MAEIFDDEVKHAEKQQLSYSAFLARLLRAQYHHRQETALAWRIKTAGLPEQWTLESFPFKRHQASSRSRSEPSPNSTSSPRPSLGLFDVDGVRANAADNLDDEVLPYVEALLVWYEDFTASGATVHAAEATLVSLDYEFAGTADLLWEKADGTVVVSDFKTSKAVYDSHFVQGGAYALAVEVMRRRSGRPLEVGAVSVIRFGGDGKYEEQEREPDRETFLAMLDLYNVRHGRAGRRNA